MPPSQSDSIPASVERVLWAQAVESLLWCLDVDTGTAFIRHMAEELARRQLPENVVELRPCAQTMREAATAFRQELPRLVRALARD